MYRTILIAALIVAGYAQSAVAQPNTKAGSVPIIYTTDLYHPHDDPDDHYDLATLFAIHEFDIRAIVIDTGQRGANRPGIPAIQQIMHITGRTVPYSIGLTDNLRTPDDRAEHQPATAQAGVELILRQLRESKTSVTIFTAGSLRDVAAAYNRDPALLQSRLARLYINIGESNGGKEWNVSLDPNAYLRILTSSLPVYWVPCFGTNGYLSQWTFRQGDVLDSAPLALQNYFVYALTKASPTQRGPLKALIEPIPDEIKKKIWNERRNMWCTGAFLHAAGRSNATISFTKVAVQLDDKAATRIISEGNGLQILTFQHGDSTAYTDSMRKILRVLFANIAAPR
jgi:hypothetical protein